MMKHKNLRIVILIIIICLSLAAFLLFRHPLSQTISEYTRESVSVIANKVSTTKFGQRSVQEKVYDDPWEEFIDKQTEDVAASFLKNRSEWFKTEAQVNHLRKSIRSQVIAMAEQYKKVLDKPPMLDFSKATFRSGIGGSTKIYEGPQTPDAIMAEWDSWYSNTYPNLAQADARFPRAEWVQDILDMGITFKTHDDYSRLMGVRRHLAAVENAPKVWASGQRGIPASDNFEEYKKAAIQRRLWEGKQVDSAEAADPEVSGGFFFDDRPDVFLPGKKNRLYVYRDPESPDSMKTWGEMMTEKQRFDLTYRGKHPEGWEVIYLDEDYNALSEKPLHMTREMVRAAQLPPEDWAPPEGWTPPDGFEDYLRERGWNGTWTQQATTEEPGPQSWATEAREAAKAEWEAAETGWKQFEQMLQEFEEFTNMSDTEKAAALQKRFMPQLPEHLTGEDIENALRKQLSPERIEKAEELLNRYGPEEGLRRLAKDDPELADQVQRALGKPANQTQDSGRFVPKTPSPIDTQPSPEDAP